MSENRLNGFHRAGTNGHARPAKPIDPDRLPPQNLDAERGVLGSILADPTSAHDVAALLDPEDFYRAAHATVYRAILDLYRKGEPVDLITLAEALQRRGDYDRVGGDALLDELRDAVPHAAHVLNYAAHVRDKGTLRRVIEASTETIRKAYDQSQTPDEVVEAAERAIYEIGARNLGGSPISVGDDLPDVLDGINARIDGPGPGVMTGLDNLDSVLHGFRPGELTVLAARPGMGKTAVALGIADAVAGDNPDPKTGELPTVLYFSMEMARKELIERLLTANAGVNGDSLRAGGEATYNALDRIERTGARSRVESLPLLVDDTSGRTTAQVAGIVRRATSRFGVRLVILDYLQLLSVDKETRRNLNREQQVAEMSRQLKVLARDCKVPVVVLAQLNREVEKRSDQRPVLSDLRESGAVEQDADVVLMLYREGYYDAGKVSSKTLEVLIRKNRHGRTGMAPIFFDPATGRIGNLDVRHNDSPY